MNRLAMFFAGVVLMCTMSGCCLMHGLGGGYGAGYPGFGGACGSCNTGCGSCGTAPGGFPSAFAPGGPQTAFAPGAVPGYPQTALIDPLPTY